MSDTPRTDREAYVTKDCDIGFPVVNPALCRQLERELAAVTQERDEWVLEVGRMQGRLASMAVELEGRAAYAEELLDLLRRAEPLIGFLPYQPVGLESLRDAVRAALAAKPVPAEDCSEPKP